MAPVGTEALAVPRAWSDVTPAWMTTALGARLPGVTVAGVEVGPIESGTNSRARVALTYSRGLGPPSVFVKCPGRMAHRLALAALGALATEARLAALGAAFPLEHPSFYAGGLDRSRLAAVVVMDDVVGAGSRANDAKTPLDVGDVASGLEGLARLHAAYWDRPLPSSLGFLRPWRLGRRWALVSAASLARGLRRLRQTAPPDASVRVDARSLERQFRRSAELAATGAQTLLHGDPHPGNTYAAPGGGTGLLDWQLARTGHWSHDVGYFLVAGLDVAARRQHERQLLAGYLDGLGRSGVAPPDWAAAWARYRATPAFGLATWLHTFSFGTLQPSDACVATIRRFAAAYDDLETWRSDVARRSSA